MTVHNTLSSAPSCQEALGAARRADAEERPHPQGKIEGAGMNEQSFELVLVPAYVRRPEETFPASPADAPSIRIHRVPFGFLSVHTCGPRSGSLM